MTTYLILAAIGIFMCGVGLGILVAVFQLARAYRHLSDEEIGAACAAAMEHEIRNRDL